MKALAAGILALVSLAVQAENYQIPMYVSVTAGDRFGDQLAYRIKEEIRKSAIVDLTLDKDEAIFELVLITMEPDNSDDPWGAIYSATINVKDPRTGLWMFVDSTLGRVGMKRIESSAASLMAWLADDAESVQSFRYSAVKVDCVDFTELRKVLDEPGEVQ